MIKRGVFQKCPQGDKQYIIQRVMRRIVPDGVDGNEKDTAYRKAAKLFFRAKSGVFQMMRQKYVSEQGFLALRA